MKGFEYVSLIGKFDERMMIHKKCTRIESQREKNQEWVLMLVGRCWQRRSVLVGRRSPYLWVLILVVEIAGCGG